MEGEEESVRVKVNMVRTGRTQSKMVVERADEHKDKAQAPANSQRQGQQ